MALNSQVQALKCHIEVSSIPCLVPKQKQYVTLSNNMVIKAPCQSIIYHWGKVKFLQGSVQRAVYLAWCEVLKEKRDRACPQEDQCHALGCCHPEGCKEHPPTPDVPRSTPGQASSWLWSKLWRNPFTTPKSGLEKILMFHIQKGGVGWDDAELRVVGGVQKLFS